MKKRTKLAAQLGAVAILGAAVAVGWWQWGAGEPEEPQAEQQRPAVEVVVAEVATGVAVDTFEGVGRVRAEDEVELAAEASGRIERIPVSDGARVEEGELLVELRTRDEEAALQAANARLAEARAEFDRSQTLLEQGHIAEARLEQARSALSTAQAEAQAARVAVEERSIVAPFAGRIGIIHVSMGDYVQPGDPLFTLVTDRDLEVEVGVPAEIVKQLGPETTIRVLRQDADPITATLGTISPSANEGTNLVAVTAALPDANFQPGENVRVVVVTDRRGDALFVPEEAILLAGPEHYVYRVTDDELARRSIVEIGKRGDGRVEITAGLEANDRVIVDGLQQVQDGRAVTPTTETAVPENGEDGPV